MTRTLAALGAIALLTIACSSAPPKEDRTAVCKSYFDKSEARFQKGEYWQIKDDLDYILGNCQGTGFAERSQFMLAESHFRLEEWIEARGEYSSFAMNFPGSPYAETASYRKAVAAYRMSYSDGRDESNTLSAIQDFERFRSDYPSSPLLDSAGFFLDSLTERQAERELKVATLYWRMNEPQAAAVYLKEFLDNYLRSPRWNESALLLIDCYIKLEQFEQARFYVDRIRQHGTVDAKLGSHLQDRSARIDSAEKAFAERLRKEQKEKLQRKADET